MIAKIETNGHWYDRNGNPRHTYINEKGEEKKTTLKQARENNWFPSVTSVLKTISKPGLEAHKITEAILASLTLPRLPDETDDAFAERVYQDSKEASLQALEFGTLVHTCCEQISSGQSLIVHDPNISKQVEAFQRWFEENVAKVVFAEKVLVNFRGFAGTCDLLYQHKDGSVRMADIKTYKQGQAPQYLEYGMQLEAYRQTHMDNGGMTVDVIENICIPKTGDDISVKVVNWNSHKSYPYLWKGFLAAFDLWCIQNHYWPVNH